MFAEQVEIKIGVLGERLLHVRIEVNGQQAAAVVGGKGEFRRRGWWKRCGNRDRHSNREPTRVMMVSQNNTPGSADCQALWTILFQSDWASISLVKVGLSLPMGYCWVKGVPAEAACMKPSLIFTETCGTGHLALQHLGVDEGFGVGMLDADAEHQCASTTVLGHLAGELE